MSISQFWQVQGVCSKRQSALCEPFEFESLVQLLQAEACNVNYKKEKGSFEAKGCWRPVFNFEVKEQTFDWFFNSPYGYRGQFLVSASDGREANSQVISALSKTLVRLADKKLSLVDLELVEKSLLSPHAKIWIDEGCYIPSQPELLLEVLVPEWEAAATTMRKRLDQKETLTNKETDRIYGVRAPLGTKLEVKGAWVGPLEVVSSKLTRAEDIKAYGIS